MTAILVQAPDKGINAALPDNMIDNREACRFSKNIATVNGEVRVPSGFGLITSGGLPLDEKVIGLYKYKEQDSTEHIIAVTLNKIYCKNNISDTWDNIILNDLTANKLLANLLYPISFATITHTDGIAVDGTGIHAYRHLLVCDGGNSPIQRWAGKYENKFYSLKGGDGYHETETPAVTNHYALQVNTFYDHVILLSPKTWNTTANVFENNSSLILWGKAGQLESSGTYNITETGAGAIDLIDTGDTNVWCLKLGSQLIVYQMHSIWSLSHVGGTDIFRARVEMNSLGLLAPHLIVSLDNRHIFIGNDYNIYVYYGGSAKEMIGHPIRDLFNTESDHTLAYRFRMAVDTYNSQLWIFYVPDGEQFATKAWVMNLKTGAWQPRDFTNVWSNNGVTSVSFLGGQSYFVGDTYGQAISEGDTYNEILTAATTYNNLMYEVIVEDGLVIGDSEGNIFQCSDDYTQDNGKAITTEFITKIFDYGLPDVAKWWDGITVVAKGDILCVSYRTSCFETETEGWREFSEICLDSDYKNYDFFIDDTGKCIQFKFANYDQYTKLLLRFDNPEKDYSIQEHTISLKNGAALSSLQYKFGGSSLFLDGVDDYVTVSPSSDWNFGEDDFTIDFWVRFNTIGSTVYFLSGRYNNYNKISFYLENNKLYFSAIKNTVSSGYSCTSSSYSFQTDTWYNIAFVRRGSRGLFFINGVLQPSETSIPMTSMPDLYEFGVYLHIGRYNGSGGLYYLNGYIDEFRISKGIARWTQNYTVPASEYSYGKKFSIREFMIHSPTTEDTL